MIISWDTSPDSSNPVYFTPLVGTKLIQLEVPINGDLWKLDDPYTTIYSIELTSGNPLLILTGYRWDNRHKYKLRISSATAYTSSHTLELRSSTGLVWFSFSGVSLSSGTGRSFELYSQYKTSDSYSFTGRFSVILKQQEVDSWGGSLTLNNSTYSTITLEPKYTTYTLGFINNLSSTVYIWDSPTPGGSPTYSIAAGATKVPITAKGGIMIQWPSASSSYTAKILGPDGVAYWSQYMPASGEQRAITDDSLLSNIQSMMSAGMYARLSS